MQLHLKSILMFDRNTDGRTDIRTKNYLRPTLEAKAERAPAYRGFGHVTTEAPASTKETR